jgi:hypothetical protein
MVGADAPSQAGRVVRAMGGDTRTSSRYDLSLGSPDLADSTDVTPIVMGHNPFTRGAAAAPPATDSEAMEGSQSAEGAQVRFRFVLPLRDARNARLTPRVSITAPRPASFISRLARSELHPPPGSTDASTERGNGSRFAQASRNCMDDGVQQTVKALEHLPSDFYFSSETDSPTLGVESRAPLDMSEYELSPNRFDCGDDCSVEEVRGSPAAGGYSGARVFCDGQLFAFTAGRLAHAGCVSSLIIPYDTAQHLDRFRRRPALPRSVRWRLASSGERNDGFPSHGLRTQRVRKAPHLDAWRGGPALLRLRRAASTSPSLAAQ